MPNYIKNRVELVGSPNDVKSLIEKFSTFYPTVPSKTHDGDLLIYKKPIEGNSWGEVGWLDEKTNIFTQREKEAVIGVPDGFIQEFDTEWTRFPDFSKIIPIPEDLYIESGSMGEAGMSHLYRIPTFMGLQEDDKRFDKMSDENKAKAIELGKKYKSNLDKYGFTTWYEWSIKTWGTKWNASSCEKESDNVYTFETAWSGVPELIRIMSANFDGDIIYKFADEDTGANVGAFIFNKGNITSKNTPANRSKEAYDLAFELRPDYKENYKLVGDSYQYVEED